MSGCPGCGAREARGRFCAYCGGELDEVRVDGLDGPRPSAVLTSARVLSEPDRAALGLSIAQVDRAFRTLAAGGFVSPNEARGREGLEPGEIVVPDGVEVTTIGDRRRRFVRGPS